MPPMDTKGQWYAQEDWGGSGEEVGRGGRMERGSKNCISEINAELNPGLWFLQVGSLSILNSTI